MKAKTMHYIMNVVKAVEPDLFVESGTECLTVLNATHTAMVGISREDGGKVLETEECKVNTLDLCKGLTNLKESSEYVMAEDGKSHTIDGIRYVHTDFSDVIDTPKPYNKYRFDFKDGMRIQLSADALKRLFAGYGGFAHEFEDTVTFAYNRKNVQIYVPAWAEINLRLEDKADVDSVQYTAVEGADLRRVVKVLRGDVTIEFKERYPVKLTWAYDGFVFNCVIAPRVLDDYSHLDYNDIMLK